MVEKHKGAPSGPVALQRIVGALADTLIGADSTDDVIVTVTGVKAGDVVNATPAAALGANLDMQVGGVLGNIVTLRFNNPTVAGIQTGAINVNFSVATFN